MRDERPASEAPFEFAEVVFAFAAIGAAGRYGSKLPCDVAPVFEKFSVSDRHVQEARLKAGGSDGVMP